MAATRTKSFTVSDEQDLEKVDGWWAGLLRKGPKEISNIEWVANGDLVWILKLSWSKLDIDSLPFNVCMPAYSGFSVDDLNEMLSSLITDRDSIHNNIKLFKTKIEDWEVIESGEPNNEYDEYNDSNIMDFGIDPNLSYATSLDVVEKIMVSEFLWPCYKALLRALLMCDTRAEEVKKEIEHRSDPSYSVVHVDRGMLRSSFTEQIGYDNQWLFANDEELYQDFIDPDDESPEA